MMELIRNWLLGITCAAMVVVLCENLTPNGAIRRVGRLAGGCVLILAILSPITGLNYGALSEAMAKTRAAAAGYEYVFEGANRDLVKTIIAQQSSAYISDKAVSLGLGACQVEVTCRYGDGDFPVPVAVRVTGDFTREQGEALGRAIEQDFAIPPEKQTLEGKREA
ncbi:MAG: stage III sporulation protein AF [Oscillospiraceae bacterium]